MSKTPYLPVEIKEKIIGMVDDIDIRRSHGVYNKIDKTRYRMLERIFPIKVFYRWKGDVAEDFNPVLTPIDEGGDDSHSYKPFLKWIVEDGGKIRTVQRSDKTVGIFKRYEIRYNLPNFIEDDFRKENGGAFNSCLMCD